METSHGPTEPEAPFSQGQPASRSPMDTHAHEPSRRILVVDDAVDNRILVVSYLRKADFKVDTASNGFEAVEKFKSTCYAAVFMDLQMPVMDGYTATREIRRWEKARSRKTTPVIAMTADAKGQPSWRSRQAGCSEHLIKPLAPAVVLEALGRHGCCGDSEG